MMGSPTTAAPTLIGAGQTASAASYQGDLILQSSSTLQTRAGVTTLVGGALNIGSGVILSLTGVGSSNTMRRRMVNQTIVAVTASSITGTFASVVASPEDECQSVQAVGTTYSSTTVSVVVQLSGDPCEGGRGLSTGAIVGIAAGSVVAGIAIVLLILCLFSRARRKRSEAMQIDIQMRNVAKYK